jgi:hypothetical protein
MSARSPFQQRDPTRWFFAILVGIATAVAVIAVNRFI